VVKEDNSAVLTHVVQIQNNKTGAWYEAFVDAHSGDLVSVTDFVSHADVSKPFSFTLLGGRLMT
jgi:extracellular elastinolytic metalloproteinase